MARIDLSHTAELDKERKQVFRIAKQLCYSSDILEKIKNAKSVHELDRIMKDARGNK